MSSTALPFKLNDEQEAALNTLVDWANTEMTNEPIYILGGFAGTGKSTLVKLFTERVKRKIALSAPTNKAVRVLSELCPYNDACTIYSLLGLKMEKKEDTLILEKALADRVGKYDIVVVDEGGMTNKTLLDYIEAAVKRYGVKFLFVGDPCQLNPVGEAKSEIWGKYPMVVLRKVERHDNQILDFATRIRGTKLHDLLIESNNDGNEGVWYLGDREFNSSIIQYAKDGKFFDEARAIAWRNRTVDQMNRTIRSAIYGASLAKSAEYLENERIVFTSPYVINDYNFITDEDAVVVSVSVGEHRIRSEIKCHYLRLSNGITVPVVHDDSLDDFTSYLGEVAHDARSTKDYGLRKRLWEEYWSLKDSVAYVSYGYALTAHRAQGSTYKTVFVDVNDILSNANRVEAKRCLYVAATRPTTKLFMK